MPHVASAVVLWEPTSRRNDKPVRRRANTLFPAPGLNAAWAQTIRPRRLTCPSTFFWEANPLHAVPPDSSAPGIRKMDRRESGM